SLRMSTWGFFAIQVFLTLTGGTVSIAPCTLRLTGAAGRGGCARRPEGAHGHAAAPEAQSAVAARRPLPSSPIVPGASALPPAAARAVPERACRAPSPDRSAAPRSGGA